jgi:hypothetical protein
MGGFSGAPATVNVRVESQPQGAEARGSTGGACRTPCTLALPATGTSTVSFALQGYLPAAVPVAVRVVRETDLPETGTGGEHVTIDPNPVFAVLDPAPPPPPPRRAAPPKPRQQPRAQQPQQQPQQQPAQAPQFGPAPPPPGFR